MSLFVRNFLFTWYVWLATPMFCLWIENMPTCPWFAFQNGVLFKQSRWCLCVLNNCFVFFSCDESVHCCNLALLRLWKNKFRHCLVIRLVNNVRKVAVMLDCLPLLLTGISNLRFFSEYLALYIVDFSNNIKKLKKTKWDNFFYG